jgi:hypothetical protein
MKVTGVTSCDGCVESSLTREKYIAIFPHSSHYPSHPSLSLFRRRRSGSGSSASGSSGPSVSGGPNLIATSARPIQDGVWGSVTDSPMGWRPPIGQIYTLAHYNNPDYKSCRICML